MNTQVKTRQFFSKTAMLTAFVLVVLATVSLTTLAQTQNQPPNQSPAKQNQTEKQKNHPGFEQIKAMEKALDASNYDAWKTAASQLPHGDELTSKITPENFTKLVSAHNLQKEAKAKMEAAQKILTDLGLKPFHHGPFGHPMKMKGSR